MTLQDTLGTTTLRPISQLPAVRSARARCGHNRALLIASGCLADDIYCFIIIVYSTQEDIMLEVPTAILGHAYPYALGEENNKSRQIVVE